MNHEEGKDAETHYRVVAREKGRTRVEFMPVTGRSHQIRVHALHLHHPLVADAVYGGRPLFGLERQGLHAWQLRFEHPILAGQMVECFAPVPPDMAGAITAAGFDIPVVEDLE